MKLVPMYVTAGLQICSFLPIWKLTKYNDLKQINDLCLQAESKIILDKRSSEASVTIKIDCGDSSE